LARLALGLGLTVVVLFLAALTLGPAQIGPIESLRALVTGDAGPLSLVMREIRLPRAILAVMVGASLGLAGAAMQGYLRNPLPSRG
jgi:iron complex transport system permease protein